jgi:hypothetical protein
LTEACLAELVICPRKLSVNNRELSGDAIYRWLAMSGKFLVSLACIEYRYAVRQKLVRVETEDGSKCAFRRVITAEKSGVSFRQTSDFRIDLENDCIAG